MHSSRYKYFVDPNSKLIDLKSFDDDLVHDADFKTGVGVSQPYVIVVRNNNNYVVENIKVFGANQNLINAAGGDADNYGNATGISITMGTEDITYANLLMQSQSQPFTVGLTYIFSGSIPQTLETYYVQYKDANGDIIRKTSAPLYDPYQYNRRIVYINDIYPIAGDTVLVLRQILARAALKLYIYPTENINMRNALGGISVKNQYQHPDIIKKQLLTLSPKAVLALKK